MGFKIDNEGKGIEPTNNTDGLINNYFHINKGNEQIIIGYALSNNRMTELMLTKCEAKHFICGDNRAIYNAINRLHEEGQEISIKLIDTIKHDFEFGINVSLNYLNELCVVHSDPIKEETFLYYIERLKSDKIKYDFAKNKLPKLQEMVFNPQASINDIIDEFNAMLRQIDDDHTRDDFYFSHTSDLSQRYHDEKFVRENGGVFGRTGYTKLDKVLTDGFAPKKISIIAGRPSMCKSSILANIMLRLAMLGIPVALYNFEMDAIAMLDRFISIITNIPLNKIIKNRESLTIDEIQKEKDANKLLDSIPLYLYEKSTNTIQGVKNDIKILKDKYGVEIVAYDLFKKMKLTSKRNSSTADMLSENLDIIQAMGKDLAIHQILIVQIGRKAESRADKRPKLSDLKDSGAFEEVADTVILLYRDQYYRISEEDEEEIDETSSHELELIIAKQRQGVQNQKILLDFFPATSTIAEPYMEV